MVVISSKLLADVWTYLLMLVCQRLQTVAEPFDPECIRAIELVIVCFLLLCALVFPLYWFFGNSPSRILLIYFIMYAVMHHMQRYPHVIPDYVYKTFLARPVCMPSWIQ